MCCAIASNRPLRKLQSEIKAEERCHSRRFRPEGCLHGLLPQEGLAASIGGAIGSCQALFGKFGNPEEHTRRFSQMLRECGMPWPDSHELFWGYRPDSMQPLEYLTTAMLPLLKDGRVPIVITNLEPQQSEVERIMDVSPVVPVGETVLLRLTLKDESSIKGAISLMKDHVRECRGIGQVQRWWPLFQGNLSLDDWKQLSFSLGSDWDFVNVAVNPFVPKETLEFLSLQVTVAQVPIGLGEDIYEDGTIVLAPGMKITGAGERAKYNLFEYFRDLTKLRIAPTVILLGPAQEGWSDQMNMERVTKAALLMRKAVDVLWSNVPSERRKQFLNMPA